MADLIIKPATGDGNKLILQDKAGGAVITTADSGATIVNTTLTSPTINTPTIATPAITGNVTASGNLTVSGNTTLTGDLVPSTPFSHRNFIYNGDFKIWQRSNSTSSVNIGNGAFQADRWKASHDISPEGLEFARSIDVPAGYGFANSLKITCDNADTSVAVGHAVSLVQEFESQDLVPWCYGTANAKNLMLSFWVKTNLTGSHSIGLIKHDNTRYGIPINYTVSSADTWEKKEILISPTAGSTSFITAGAGAIDNDNGHGASLIWNLASGSNYQSTNNTWVTSIDKRSMGTSSDQNFVGSTSNNFYITGVQLELGSNATPFEHRSYGDELARCQRYFQTYNPTQQALVYNEGSTSTHKFTMFYIMNPMRTAPSVSLANLTTGSGVGGLSGTISSVTLSSSPVPIPPCIISCRCNMSTSSGTARYMYHTDAWANDPLEYSAEL